MAYLDDISMIIEAGTTEAGSTHATWPVYRGMLPDSTVVDDRAVALLHTPGMGDLGGDSSGGLWVERPGLQVLTRGRSLSQYSSAYTEAEAIARAVNLTLHGFTGPLASYFAERFEAVGTDRTWDLGATVDGAGNAGDPDAAPPSGTVGWGNACLKVTAGGASTGTTTVAYGHTALSSDKQRTVVDWNFFVDSFSTAAGTLQLAMVRLYHDSTTLVGTGEDRVVRAHLVRRSSDSALVCRFEVFSSDEVTIGVDYDSSPLSTGVAYSARIDWDLSRATWEVSLGGLVVGSSSLFGAAAAREVTFVSVGPVGNAGTIAAVFYVDNLDIKQELGAHYVGIWNESSMGFIGYDMSMRPVFSANYRVQKNKT